MKTRHLMVVDDSMVFRNRISRLAADERLQGVKVVALAADGVEALEQARQYKPDFVTMDLTMPRMDGPECLEAPRTVLPEARVLVTATS